MCPSLVSADELSREPKGRCPAARSYIDPRIDPVRFLSSVCRSRLIWLARLGAVVAAIFLPAALLNAALPTPEEAPKHPSLVGQLLVASPEMGDPRFYHAVILVVTAPWASSSIDQWKIGHWRASWRRWATRTQGSWGASVSSRALSRKSASRRTQRTIIALRQSTSTVAWL